jgi:hypothetical protein
MADEFPAPELAHSLPDGASEDLAPVLPANSAAGARPGHRDGGTVYMVSTYLTGTSESVSEVPVLMVGRQGLEPWTR